MYVYIYICISCYTPSISQSSPGRTCYSKLIHISQGEAQLDMSRCASGISGATEFATNCAQSETVVIYVFYHA